MDTSFNHGVRVFDDNDLPVFIRTRQSAVGALTVIADDADPVAFPLDRQVLIKGGNDYAIAKKLGKGEALSAVDGYFDNCSSYLMITRVARGATHRETIASIIGDRASKTGLYSWLRAEATFGRKLKPRLFGMSGGYTTSLGRGVIAAHPGSQGGDYTSLPTIRVANPAGAQGQPKFQAVLTDQRLTGVIVLDPGHDLGDAPDLIVEGGGGSGATAGCTIGTVSNPICSRYPQLLTELRAVAFVDGPGTTAEDEVLWAQTMQSDRLYAINMPVMVLDKTLGVNVPRPASPYFMGAQARTDRENGYWWSVSNKQLYGIESPGGTREVSYGGDVNYLNENHVNSIIAGDQGGYVAYGNRMRTEQSFKLFLPVRRTSDVISEAIETQLRPFVDRPMLPHEVRMTEDAGNDFMRDLRGEGAIYDGRMFWDNQRNSDSELASGALTLGVDYLVPPPIEDLRVGQNYNMKYFAVLRDKVLQEEGATFARLAA